MKALIGEILFSELNWRFCSNLANLEEILSTNYNYKLQHHKTLKNLKTNEEKLFKELTCWRPHMDCIMLSERDLKSYPLQVHTYIGLINGHPFSFCTACRCWLNVNIMKKKYTYFVLYIQARFYISFV